MLYSPQAMPRGADHGPRPLGGADMTGADVRPGCEASLPHEALAGLCLPFGVLERQRPRHLGPVVRATGLAAGPPGGADQAEVLRSSLERAGPRVARSAFSRGVDAPLARFLAALADRALAYARAPQPACRAHRCQERGAPGPQAPGADAAPTRRDAPARGLGAGPASGLAAGGVLSGEGPRLRIPRGRRQAPLAAERRRVHPDWRSPPWAASALGLGPTPGLETPTGHAHTGQPRSSQGGGFSGHIWGGTFKTKQEAEQRQGPLSQTMNTAVFTEVIAGSVGQE